MKRFLLAMMLLVCSVASYAQQEVTRFLGIPVDGKKSVMIKKLKKKGFTADPSNKNALVGNFNGSKVNVYVVTNNDKVCRIMVCDVYMLDARDIKIRFNTLCRQFQENERYTPASLLSDYTLSEEEDISYEITVHHKRYEATYFQRPATTDSAIAAILQDKYPEEVLKNPTEEQRKEMEVTVAFHMFDKYSKNLVWFMISEYCGLLTNI